MHDPIPPIPYLRLRVHLAARAAARLPAFHGSLLRGAFGHALRRVVCVAERGQLCEVCPARGSCGYARLFEPVLEGESSPFARNVAEVPRPFVVEPLGARRDFAAGEALAFDLLLFGRAVDAQAFVVLALERMARAGLGPHRAPFTLERVEALGADGAFRPGFVRGELAWGAPAPALLPAPPALAGERLTLRLKTPLRLKGRHEIYREAPSFRLLAFRMVRRALEMAHHHVPGAKVDWREGAFRPLLEKAAAIRLDGSRLNWRPLERYSNRQRRRLPLGGLAGTLSLEGELAPFAPLLATAEILHVGKGATSGLGWVGVEGWT